MLAHVCELFQQVLEGRGVMLGATSHKADSRGGAAVHAPEGVAPAGSLLLFGRHCLVKDL
eukprot:scaffold9370_cov13-Tisochrysis_lutea.AAC.1